MKTFNVHIYWRRACVKTTTLATVRDHPEEDSLRVEIMNHLGAAAVYDLGHGDRPLDEFTVQFELIPNVSDLSHEWQIQYLVEKLFGPRG